MIRHVHIRRMTVGDIPARVDLLQDEHVKENIEDLAAVLPRRQIEAHNFQRMNDEESHHIDLVLENSSGAVLGYSWLSGIDWQSRLCEVSIALLPEYRGGLGHICYLAVKVFVFQSLGIRSILCQVLSSNRMMIGGEQLKKKATMHSKWDAYIAGEWRECYLWIEDSESFEAAMGRAGM